MVRSKLKSIPYALFFLWIFGVVTILADDAKEQLQKLKTDYAKQRLRSLLHEHPNLAQKFLEELEKKSTSTKPTPPSMPVQPEPVRPPEVKPAPLPEVRPEPIPTPMPKVEEAPKPWMTDREKSNVNTIFSVLESNAIGVYKCLSDFFCKDNCQPYRVHISCLKSQIAYLHDNLTNKFPQTDTAERRKIFMEFQKLASILDDAETELLKIINQQYAPSYVGAVQLGLEFAKTEPLLDTWNKQANAAINLLIREFRTGTDTVSRFTKLRESINKMFHFGSNMSRMEALNIMVHRLSK